MVDNGDGPRSARPSALVAAWKLNAEGVDTMYHQISAPIVSFQVRMIKIQGGGGVVWYAGVVVYVIADVSMGEIRGRPSSLATDSLYCRNSAVSHTPGCPCRSISSPHFRNSLFLPLLLLTATPLQFPPPS